MRYLDKDKTMALQADVTKFGVTLPNGYHQVDYLYISKKAVRFAVIVYTAKDGERVTHFDHSMDYNPDGAEPLTQAYEYLKTLPEYAGAIDV